MTDDKIVLIALFSVCLAALLAGTFIAWQAEKNTTAFAIECVQSGGTYKDKECTR